MNTQTTAAYYGARLRRKVTKRERLERRRAAHHAALATLLGPDTDPSAGFALWRKLRRIELDLHRTCLEYTNGEPTVQLAQWELHKAHARKQLLALFGGSLPAGLFINGDPRGHMLKLDCGSAGSPGVPIPDGMERDWGGNGILAADINEP